MADKPNDSLPSNFAKIEAEVIADELARKRDAKITAEMSEAQLDGKRAEGDERPELYVGSGAELFDELREHVGTGPLAGLFYRAGGLCRVVPIDEEGYVEPDDPHDADGPAQVQPINAKAFRARLQVAYYCWKMAGKAPNKLPVQAAPYLTPCEDLLEAVQAGDCPNLPILRGVIHTPIARADGSVFDEPGFDPRSGLLYLPNGLDLPEIPNRPSKEDVEQARNWLEHLITDFPFESEHDRANYLALLITPLLRLLVPPPWPLGVLNAHQTRSGKTLLAKIFDELYGFVFRSPPAADDDEVRKSITSILRSTTAPVVVFDNIKRVLNSGELEALLTTAKWSDRVLGVSQETGVLPNDRLWMVTGNNVTMGLEFSGRSVVASIDPRTAHPEERDGFAEPNLLSFARECRGDLLGAALTLVRAWVRAGRPVGARRSDDYGDWQASLGGILDVAGIKGEVWAPETSARVAIGGADHEWSDFLAAVYAIHERNSWMARDIIELAVSGFDDTEAIKELRKQYDTKAVTKGIKELKERHEKLQKRLHEALPGDLADKVERNQSGAVKSLGHWLKNRIGTYAGGLCVRQHLDRDGISHWRIAGTPES